MGLYDILASLPGAAYNSATYLPRTIAQSFANRGLGSLLVGSPATALMTGYQVMKPQPLNAGEQDLLVPDGKGGYTPNPNNPLAVKLASGQLKLGDPVTPGTNSPPVVNPSANGPLNAAQAAQGGASPVPLPRPRPQAPMPMSLAPTNPGPSFSPSMIPGYTQGVPNMADPTQARAALGPNMGARLVPDGNGGMMNDFFKMPAPSNDPTQTTSGPSLIQRVMNALSDKYSTANNNNPTQYGGLY